MKGLGYKTENEGYGIKRMQKRTERKMLQRRISYGGGDFKGMETRDGEALLLNQRAIASATSVERQRNG